MTDAAELKRRAAQHEQAADEKANHFAARHEGIAEGYRRAAMLFVDGDGDHDAGTVELTLEFDTPVTCDDLQERFEALADRMADAGDDEPEEQD